MSGVSYLASWLKAKRGAFSFPRPDVDSRLIARADVLSQRSQHKSLLDGWQPTTRAALTTMFMEESLPPVFKDALDFTAFALDQFKERADRDGGSLAVLSIYRMGTRGDPHFDRLNAMAEARGIPVIDQYDYILRQGAKPEDTRWAYDGHWNSTGHQWAAEALLEYLKQHQEICAGPAAKKAL